ncbi:MAG TPA: M67 family metallopeptidase [Acidisarcina sp.]
MLDIPEAIYQGLRRHGEETYPYECCGILLGRSSHAAVDGVSINEVVQAVRAGNTRTDSAHNRYNIAPHDLVRAQRQGRQRGLDIIGFYHSHPDHPAQWSSTDLAEAHWIGCSYVITAVEQGRAAATRSFLLTGSSEEEKRFEDEPVSIRQNLIAEDDIEVIQSATED